MVKEKLFGDLIDEKNNLISDNWITPEDIVEYVKENLTSVEEQKLVNIEKIMEKLKNTGIPLIELHNSSKRYKKIRVLNLSEYLKYLEVMKSRVLFVYEDFTIHCYEEYDNEPFSLYIDVEKEFKMCGIMEKINEIAKVFLENNDLISEEIDVFDENKVGISYKSEGNIIEELGKNLNLLGEKLIEQKDILEEIQYDKAMEEVKCLYSYLILNNDFLNCKTEKQCKLYKEKGKYLSDERFKNLKYMIENKPIINSEKYIKYRMLYIELEDTFERARRFVKGENK